AERAAAEDARKDAAEARRREAAIAAVLAADDATVRTAEATGGGRISVVVSASQDRAVVVLSELSAVDRDQAYQLWVIAGAVPRSAGVLPAGATGATRLLEGLGDADLLGVTVEPAGGSPRPTTTPVAAVPLT
ncbi:MAG: anti-sigma factor domain-containing protein, partial [Micromonosporaceae bacterium]